MLNDVLSSNISFSKITHSLLVKKFNFKSHENLQMKMKTFYTYNENELQIVCCKYNNNLSLSLLFSMKEPSTSKLTPNIFHFLVIKCSNRVIHRNCQ